jgi:hypothetical protein
MDGNSPMGSQLSRAGESRANVKLSTMNEKKIHSTHVWHAHCSNDETDGSLLMAINQRLGIVPNFNYRPPA